jgi:hypothetical protein
MKRSSCSPSGGDSVVRVGLAGFDGQAEQPGSLHLVDGGVDVEAVHEGFPSRYYDNLLS